MIAFLNFAYVGDNMTTYFITRHLGALQWAEANQVNFDVHLEHLLTLDQLKKGDVVIGTLPINIITALFGAPIVISILLSNKNEVR